MSVQDTIRDQVTKHRVVLYMKGTPQFPQCGFSSAATQMLKACGVDDFFSVNVLADPEIRQGIKDYANWPTIPQLYVNGEFVGGSDIMREMYESGELQQLLRQAGGLRPAAGVRPRFPRGTGADLRVRARGPDRCIHTRALGTRSRDRGRIRQSSASQGKSMESLKAGSDALFILLGAVMVLAMHAGFAFLELGTVRRKNQVNALVKILVDFSVSTIAYFFIGYSVAYGVNFFAGAETLAQKNGYELVKFFFLLTFAAAIPAIVSGGIAERARFNPQLAATFLLVGFVYPFFEGIAWNQHFGVQAWLKGTFGAEFHDFAGSVVVHAMGGWIGLMAVLLLGARRGRYTKEGAISAHPPSSIPFLALGAWILSVGWFGFNVMSAQTIDKISGWWR